MYINDLEGYLKYTYILYIIKTPNLYWRKNFNSRKLL